MAKSLSIVIPCYNESGCLIPLFERLEKLISLDGDLEIIIVDNGSTDNSSEIIKNHLLYTKNLINLVTVEKNIGYGHGIMSGVYESSSKYVSWCHSDLEIEPIYNYEAFIKNIKNLENKKCIIKGLRKKRSVMDIFFTTGMSLFTSLVFMKKLTDVNAQPKIFPRHFLSLLKNPPNDFSLDLYLLVVARFNVYKIIDYPVIVNKRIAGEAKGGGGTFKNKIKLTLKTLSFIFHLRKNFKKLIF